jgi:AcrR family transcriptional regulator
MSKKEKRGRPKSDPNERREEILLAAVELFAENGFRTTELQQIADAVSIAKGTIYLYFDSKKSLFFAAVERAVHNLAAHIEREVDKASGAAEKTKAIIRAHFRFFNEDIHLATILASEQGEFLLQAEKTYLRVYSKNASHLEAIIRQGMEAGEFTPADPRLTTEVFANLLGGMIYSQIRGQKSLSSVNSVEKHTDFFLYGIAGRPVDKKCRSN